MNEYIGLRKENLTQQEVAAGSGLTLRAYQNHERREREPRLDAVIALADFYGVAMDELIGRALSQDKGNRR